MIPSSRRLLLLPCLLTSSTRQCSLLNRGGTPSPLLLLTRRYHVHRSFPPTHGIHRSPSFFLPSSLVSTTTRSKTRRGFGTEEEAETYLSKFYTMKIRNTESSTGALSILEEIKRSASFIPKEVSFSFFFLFLFSFSFFSFSFFSSSFSPLFSLSLFSFSFLFLFSLSLSLSFSLSLFLFLSSRLSSHSLLIL
jgi:hypothetical protein